MDSFIRLLHDAIEQAENERFLELLNVDGVDPTVFINGRNAYHVAVESGNYECLVELLKDPTNDHHMRSPKTFLTPVETGKKILDSVVNTVYGHKRRMIQGCVYLLVRSPSYQRTTLDVLEDIRCLKCDMHHIIACRNLEGLKDALEENPSQASSFPYPLFLCTVYRFTQGIDLLVDTYKVNVEIRNLEGLTALAYAAVNKDKEMSFYLLSKGCSPATEICPGITIEDVLKNQ